MKASYNIHEESTALFLSAAAGSAGLAFKLNQPLKMD